MLKRALRMMRYGTLLLRIGGFRVFFSQLRRQSYSRDTLFGLEKNLNTNGVGVHSRLAYSLRKASEKDIEEMLAGARAESRESAHELIERKWFYECGFHDCYAGRAVDTGELCFLAWLVSAKDGELVRQGFQSRLPDLKQDELLLENCYTFEKYRGKNIMTSAVAELCRLAGGDGCKRLITYVRKDNVASMRAFEKLSFSKFEEVPELKLFFYTRRKNH